MAFYDDMATVTLDLISEFGQVGTLTNVIPGAYDPETGETTGDTEVSQDGHLILLDYSLQESGTKYAEGSQVLSGDKKILLAAKGLAWPPALTTRITAGGDVWQIVNIKASNPAGTPLVYELHGRK